MNFWSIIFLLAGTLWMGSIIYLISRISKFGFIKKLSKDRKLTGVLISVIVVALAMSVLILTIGFINAAVILIHLMLIWILCEVVFLVIKRIRKQPFKRYYAGAAAVLVTAVYFLASMFFAYNVWEKDYELTSDKLTSGLRVAMFADSHVGTTFDGEGFAKHLEEIQKTNPDILVIAGDFVDDDTTKEDMIRCCEALGDFETKYGIFYAYGNHDRGYFDYRNFSAAELSENLEANGVTVLRDEAALIDDAFYVVGRRDMSESLPDAPRAEMSELLGGLDSSKYTIVIDHQPADYEAQAASGADLVLSGHTHGGQMLGLNWIMGLTGANDMIYGTKTVDDTVFVVTSGISDWALKFKTCCRSEYVVIDIN